MHEPNISDVVET